MYHSLSRNIFILFAIYFLTVSSALASLIDYDELIKKLEQDRIEIAEIMEESTVFVLGTGKSDEDEVELGTGFMVAPNYILTNGHVTEGCEKIYVSSNTLSLREAKVIKEINDGVNDFALLKFTGPNKFPILSFNTNIRRTDKVSAWGYPVVVSSFDNKLDQILDGKFDGTPPLVYTEGVVSSFVDDGKAVSIIHSAIVAGGNSGGPLINARGEVVGINSWRSLDVQEGSMVNAALTAQSAMAFLRSCGVEPRIAPNGESKVNKNTTVRVEDKKNSTNALKLAEDKKSTKKSTSKNKAQIEPKQPAGLSTEMQEAYSFARQGDAEAQTFVGVSLYYGDEAPEIPEIGIYWLQQAMSKDNADAYAMYAGIQIADPRYRNIKEGLKNLRYAISKNAHHGNMLAQILYAGEVFGIDRNYGEAFAMAKKSAEANNIDGVALLAFFYLQGIGTKKDDAKALKLANKAIKDEQPLAYAVLSWLHYKGKAVKQDDNLAFKYAKMSADADMHEGMALLGHFYSSGIGVEENPELAFTWAKEAADRGNDLGRTLTGLFYVQGHGVKKDLVLGMAYLDLAVLVGYNDAKPIYNDHLKQLNKKQKEHVKILVNTWFDQWGF